MRGMRRHCPHLSQNAEHITTRRVMCLNAGTPAEDFSRRLIENQQNEDGEQFPVLRRTGGGFIGRCVKVVG